MGGPVIQPGEVPIFDGEGNLYAVPEKAVGEAVRQGGRVASAAEVQEHELGGKTGALVAGGLGALETLTGGGSTAVAGELGVAQGGQRRRMEVEDEIRAIEAQNPISHMLGTVAPMFAVPEMAGEAGPLIAGEGAAARALNFALPRFAEGVAQDAHLQGSQGVSDDLLKHNFTAQSYLSHAASPEVLVAGGLNVAIGAGLHGLAKLGGESALGTAGKLAAEDGLAADRITAAAQKSGRTSAEASEMFGGMQDLAQQAAGAGPERASLIESFARAHARAMAKGSPEVETALTRAYEETIDRFAGAERVLDKTTREAVTHSDELFKGLGRMNELQFGLKPMVVERLVDPTKITQQLDAALGLNRDVRSLLDEALSTGVDVRGPEVKKLFDLTKRLDGAISDVVEVNAKGIGKASAETAARKAAAKLYIALDDGKRVVGRAARFGHEGKDGTAQIAEQIYETHFRGMLEDASLWGDDLGKMQAATNASFSDGFASYLRFNRMLGQVLETPGGRKLYSTEYGRMRSALTELEHASTPEDIVGLRAEVIQRVVDNTRGRARSMIETMDLKPGDVSELRKTVNAANSLETTLKRAQKEASESRTLKELKAREMAGGSGGIVKNTVGLISSPVRFRQILGGLKKAEDKVRQVIAKDARAFVSGEKIMTSAPKATTKMDRKALEKTMLDLQKVASDPTLMRERVRKLIGSISDVSPATGAAVAATAARFITYLAGEVPPPLPPRFLETDPRWADSDVDAFGKKLHTALHPLTTFQKMQSGRLSTGDQKLLKSVYDELYSEMKISLLREYKQAEQDGYLKKFDSQERLMLATMLEAPLEGSQQTPFISRMQQAAMSDPNAQGAIGAQAQGGGRPKKVTLQLDGLQTESEKISGP